MSGLDLEAIKARLAKCDTGRGLILPYEGSAFDDMAALLAVVERLEADLALTRAERDQHKRHYDELLAQMQGGTGAKAALRTMNAARDQLSKELAREEARAEEVIGELNEQLIRALRRECGATCRATAERLVELENALNWGTECLSCSRVLDACHEAEHKASDSAELAKATREKLREAHNDMFKLAAHIRECERQLQDAHSRLARYEAQCVGCTTETFDGAPGSVKLNADATCPLHGEYGKLRE